MQDPSIQAARRYAEGGLSGRTNPLKRFKERIQEITRWSVVNNATTRRTRHSVEKHSSLGKVGFPIVFAVGCCPSFLPLRWSLIEIRKSAIKSA